MRELAYVQTIKSLTPILGADNIEKAEVLGWELVVKKGDFAVGDLCVYVEIDSILPEIPCFEFLRAKKFRIRTVKLRGQCSQGIALPLSIIKEVDSSVDTAALRVGQDLTDILRITKYDPESELDSKTDQPKKSWLSNKWSFIKWKLFKIKPVKRDSFPEDVPKTNEERVQKMGSSLEQYAGTPVYITEKCEGSSATFIYRRGGNWLSNLFGLGHVFQVCSRNIIVYSSQHKKQTAHYLMQVAETYQIEQQLKLLNRNLAIQGEVIGPKIQGNIYNLSDHQFRVFLIFDLDKQQYVPYQELVSLTIALGLSMVPVTEKWAFLINDIKYYVGLSRGNSQISRDVLREGIVIRSLTDNFSFKSINPDYLLKQK